MMFKNSSTVMSVVWSVLFVCFAFSTMGTAQPCERFEIQKLTASDGEARDYFGTGIEIAGDTAAIGAYGAQTEGSASGTVYLFSRQGGAWVEDAEIHPFGLSEEAYFGRTISIQDDLMVIGAHGQIHDGIRSGAAYVYRKIGEAWIEEAMLLPSNPVEGGTFGFPVKIHQGRILVGSPYSNEQAPGSGSVYVFGYEDGAWIERDKMIAAGGVEEDFFGSAIEVSAETLVIGHPGRYTFPVETRKRVYIYQHNENGYEEIARLNAGDIGIDGIEHAGFGIIIAIDGDHLLAGVAFENGAGPFLRGAVHAYRYDGGQWVYRQRLEASDGVNFDLFGEDVEIVGNTAVIGAWGADENGIDETGAAYVFRFDGEYWVEDTKLLASDGAYRDRAGWTIALQDSTALLGAFFSDPNGENSGAVYVFDTSPCIADLTGDCTLNIFDLLAFLDAFNAEGIIADFTSDGFFDINDVFAFLDSFNAGCP